MYACLQVRTATNSLVCMQQGGYLSVTLVLVTHAISPDLLKRAGIIRERSTCSKQARPCVGEGPHDHEHTTRSGLIFFVISISPGDASLAVLHRNNFLQHRKWLLAAWRAACHGGQWRIGSAQG